MQNNSTYHSKGFTLLELIIALAAMAFIMSLQISSDSKAQEEGEAKVLGSELTQYNNGVRGYISKNVGNPTLYANSPTTFTGTSWLKGISECSDGTGDVEFIACGFNKNVGKTDLEYTTVIYADSTNMSLRASTFVDFKKTPNTTILSETLLGLAVLNANGGSIRNAQEINLAEVTTQTNAAGETFSNIIINGLDSMFYYCPNNVSNASLNTNCRKSAAGSKEGGLIVLTTETKGENDSYLLANGGNSMHRSFLFDAAPLNRKMAGVDRLYNLTGELLKIGNSGIYQSGDWAPTLGDGLIIDTDMYTSRSIKTKGNITTEFDMLTKSNLVSDSNIVAKSGLIVEGSQSVKGELNVINRAKYNDDVDSFGLVSSLGLNIGSFASANEVIGLNTISAGVIANAPQITASTALISNKDLNVAEDSIIGGNSYTEGNSATKGDIYSDSVQFETGRSFLKDVYVNSIYSNNGSYMIDPSGVTSTSITKANKIYSSGVGANMGFASNSVLLTREKESCGNTADCATSIEAYVDTSRLYIKSPKNGNWVGLTGLLVDLESKARN